MQAVGMKNRTSLHSIYDFSFKTRGSLCSGISNISNTTPIAVPKDFWSMPYRHWKFTTPEFRNDK